MLKPKVLIIDDDVAYLELLQEALEIDFSVVCAKNLDEVEKIAKPMLRQKHSTLLSSMKISVKKKVQNG